MWSSILVVCPDSIHEKRYKENKLTWVIRSVDIQKILVTPNNFAILFAVLIYWFTECRIRILVRLNSMTPLLNSKNI